MEPFYLKISNSLSLKVIPKTQIYMDGHPILTHSYSLYRNNGNHNDNVISKSEEPDGNSADYMGVLTFDIPGKLFNYVTDGPNELSREEIEKVVEQITYYRDNPSMWRHL